MRQKELKINQNVYHSLLNNTPLPPPETGGIIGGKDGIITCYFADKGESSCDFYRYYPNTNNLNNIISFWEKNNIDFMGIYHSHPLRNDELSSADIKYINNIMNDIKDFKQKLYFPLVIPQTKLIGFCAVNVADEIKIFQTAIKIL
ncbi:MAG: hypothetical protein IJZ59_01515 [Alphaproteobacteria bacterium]|nr:hypothetical protein [Alphaproteobacteria bacterium]